eukprot:jgi/Chlat1/6619/Chrsp482S09073
MARQGAGVLLLCVALLAVCSTATATLPNCIDIEADITIDIDLGLRIGAPKVTCDNELLTFVLAKVKPFKIGVSGLVSINGFCTVPSKGINNLPCTLFVAALVNVDLVSGRKLLTTGSTTVNACIGLELTISHILITNKCNCIAEIAGNIIVNVSVPPADMLTSSICEITEHLPTKIGQVKILVGLLNNLCQPTTIVGGILPVGVIPIALP